MAIGRLRRLLNNVWVERIVPRSLKSGTQVKVAKTKEGGVSLEVVEGWSLIQMEEMSYAEKERFLVSKETAVDLIHELMKGKKLRDIKGRYWVDSS